MSRSPDLTPQAPMPEIPHRNDIVNRIVKEQGAEYNTVLRLVASRLLNTKTLPVEFKAAEFGSREVRSKVLDYLKARDWKVVHVNRQVGDVSEEVFLVE